MTPQQMKRIRTIRWEDPLAAASEGLGMSGLAAVQAMGDGRLPRPPFGALLGIEGRAVAEGSVSLTLTPAEFHYSSTGAAHGGVAAALLDSATYLAVHSTLPAGVFASTLQLNVHFLRPISVETGEVLADAQILHRGRQLAIAGAEIRDGAGKLLVQGTATCLIRTG